jgi:hypothetical protein
VSECDTSQSAPAGDDGQQAHLDQDLAEGASPGQTDAFDGAAAAGSLGAVSGAGHDDAIPQMPRTPYGPD